MIRKTKKKKNITKQNRDQKQNDTDTARQHNDKQHTIISKSAIDRVAQIVTK